MLINKKEYIEAKKELFGKDSTIEKIIKNYFNKTDLSEQILNIQPIYYDEKKIWWVWNRKEFKWEITDETNILNFVRKLSFANTIKSKEKSEILEAIKQESRLNKPKDMKKTWVQFKDTIVDIESGEEFNASSEYFITNPIPYKLHNEKYIKTPIMDKIFEEWVGKDYVQTLYEIISYCLIPDYPIHRIFCFIGEGMNGKSCFLNLLRKFIGEENVCSTELDTLLTSRFEITRLYKKLVCQMGETNFNEMSKTSILKKLSGGDLIGFEYKGKNPFEDINYAKILISTNNLPTTTDKTIGFYRRWLIIDFPNRFSEKKDILNDIPEEEYEILAVKCLGILKDLLDKREFNEEGSIEDRAKKYEDKSDPLEKFIKEFMIEDVDGFIWKFDFEKKLNEWCKENKFRQLSEVVIGKKMKEKGIIQELRQSNWITDGQNKRYRAWIGIKLKGNEQGEQDEH
jgi:putative DNA primase/helicase